MTTKSDNYAYIYAWDADPNGVNAEGFKTPTLTAYAVLADGTKAVYDVAVDTTGSDTSVKYYWEDAAQTSENEIDLNKGYVIAYSINDDGELVHEEAQDTIKWQGNTLTVDKDNAAIGDAYANASTQYIFADVQSTKVDVTVVTGYRNVKIESGSSVTTVADDDGNALYVFVKAANGTLSSDDAYAVLLDDKVVVTKDGNDTFYTYTVAIDGEETELTWKNTDKASSLKIGQVFKFQMDGEYVKQANITAESATSVLSANEDYVIVTGNTQYNLGAEEIYTITREFEDETAWNQGSGTPDSATVSVGGSIEKDDSVILVLDEKDIVIAFVIEDIY